MRISPRWGRCRGNASSVGKIGWWLVFVVVVVFGSGVSARADVPVRVLVYNYAGVPEQVVRDAEREAGKLLGVTSAQLEWVSCAPVSSDELCVRGWTKESPGLRFITGFNKYQVREFGHADVPVLATIYYEQVARRVHQEGADSKIGAVLGALMAHELGHLLLEDDEHAKAGVMEASWGSSQIRAALMGKMAFTDEEIRRLKERFVVLRAARVNTD